MKSYKTLFLSIILSIFAFSFPFFIPSTYAQDGYGEYGGEYGGYYPGSSQLQVRQDINYIYYPWTLPDENNAENYCEDPSGMTDISQVQVKLKKYTWVVDVECIDPNDQSGGTKTTSVYYKAFTITNTANKQENNHTLEHYPRGLTNYCGVAEWNGSIADMPNYSSIIQYTENIIENENKLEISCKNKLNKQEVKHTIIYQKEVATQPTTETQPQEIEGCTDSTATNYNPNATIHKESDCQYTEETEVYTPQNITGYFTQPVQVQSGATSFNLTLNLNVQNATINTQKIHLWDKFEISNQTSKNDTITLTLQQFDGQRINAECNTYELIIPANAITTEQGDTNKNQIRGNFEIVGCEKTNIGQENENETTNETSENETKNQLKEKNMYLSLFEKDENGKEYLNITNTIYLLGILSFFLIIFFVFFGFLKNSFLGKGKKSYR